MSTPAGGCYRSNGMCGGVSEWLTQMALVELRARGASWRAIAERLEAKDVISPGQRDAHIHARGWTATVVWRIGKRHGLS